MDRLPISRRCPACGGDAWVRATKTCAACGAHYARQKPGWVAALMIVVGICLLLVGGCGILGAFYASEMGPLVVILFALIAFIGVGVLREAGRNLRVAPPPGFPVLPKMSDSRESAEAVPPGEPQTPDGNADVGP